MAYLQKLKKILYNAENIPLNSADIKSYTGLDVIRYDLIINYSSLDELINNDNQAIIVMYMSSYNSGHYVLIFRDNNNDINFWDSFALGVDMELDYLPFYTNQLNGKPLLKHLAHEYISLGNRVITNNYRLQSNKRETNVCGAYCIARWLLRRINNKDFAEVYIQGSKLLRGSPDDFLVVMMYFKIYNELDENK